MKLVQLLSITAGIGCALAASGTLTAQELPPGAKPLKPASDSRPANVVKTDTSGLFSADFNKAPTYIKADTLTFKSKERSFVYNGDVDVRHGDMILTANSLEGKYDQRNQIETLIARRNVVVTKGPDIRGTGELATYDARSETITLTENPELMQKDNILSADVIRIFLKEDRAIAEGEVRVKVVKTDLNIEKVKEQ